MDIPAFTRHDRAAREAAEESLSSAATRSAKTRGRARLEDPDPYRTGFERDRDRILHSKAFRRLKHKTQVFINPTGDHYVTRLTHTLQVTQIARALARALGLNEPLAEAVALGHDVGHSPFGHTGEDVIAEYFADGWDHAAQSVRIFEVLEDRNLTWEVRDGIRAHPWRVEPGPSTPEAACVRFADRIAYLSHDALDARRAGLLRAEEFPATVRDRLGAPGSEWIGRMIAAVVDHTVATGVVGMDDGNLTVMHELRAFMFDRVYRSGHNEEQKRVAGTVIRRLMDHHLANPAQVPRTYRDSGADLPTQVADYVAGMTDRYAVALHDRLAPS